MSQWGHREEVHTEGKQLLGQNHLHFCFLPSRGWAWAYQEPLLSACLFFIGGRRLFLENRPQRMCVRLDHTFNDTGPDRGGLEWTEIDKWPPHYNPHWLRQGGLGLPFGKLDEVDRKPRLRMSHQASTKSFMKQSRYLNMKQFGKGLSSSNYCKMIQLAADETRKTKSKSVAFVLNSHWALALY